MYISQSCILCGFSCFKFHGYLLVSNFCALNFAQKIAHQWRFFSRVLARPHDNKGFSSYFHLLMAYCTSSYQLSLAPQQKGREHTFLHIHHAATTSPCLGLHPQGIQPNVLEDVIPTYSIINILCKRSKYFLIACVESLVL